MSAGLKIPAETGETERLRLAPAVAHLVGPSLFAATAKQVQAHRRYY